MTDLSKIPEGQIGLVARVLLRENVDLIGFSTQRTTAPAWVEHGPAGECWTNAYDNLMRHDPNGERYAYCEGYVTGRRTDVNDEGSAHGFLVDRRKLAVVECTVADARTRWGDDVTYRGIPLVNSDVREVQERMRAAARANELDDEPEAVCSAFETIVVAAHGLRGDVPERNVLSVIETVTVGAVASVNPIIERALNRLVDWDLLRVMGGGR